MNRGSVQEASEAPAGRSANASSRGQVGVARSRVLKFGGTSLESEARFASVVRRVREVRDEGLRPVVVVSAVGGTTDSLEAAALRAQGAARPATLGAGDAGPGRPSADPSGSGAGAVGSVRAILGLSELRDAHHRLLLALACEAEVPALRARVDEMFRDIESVVQGVELVGECSPRVRDRLLAHGELLSSLLVAAGLRARGVDAHAVDARELILTDSRFGAATVDRPASAERIRSALAAGGAVPVVTGFLASTARGETTTLGRGASDLTATLVGAALGADAVEIWTDVGGIHTADPRSVPLAQPLEELSYDELLEMANFGARVMCPLAVEPVREANIPLRILSTVDPSLPGTRVVARPEVRGRPVRGISAIRNAALLRLEGVERLGVSETAERLYRALRAVDARPLLFTQDSSAHSISIAVAGDVLADVLDAVRSEFERERAAGLLGDPVAQERRSVLALVGEGMRDTPGVAGRLFSTLGRSGVNVHAIAQGSSERNISWVVASEDEARALQVVHDQFLSGQPRASRNGNGAAAPDVADDPAAVRVAVMGAGRVGAAFLDQLARHGVPALEARGVRPVLVAVARSRVAAVAAQGFEAAEWRRHLSEAGDAPGRAVELVAGFPVPGILVDCTASGEVGARYPEVLRAGGAVVTANKLPLAGELAAYREIEAAAASGAGLHNETTVGAGLPLLRALRDLQSTGDPLVRLRGVLSGSLSFIFQRVNEGADFSEAVREATRMGLTEPNPAEDLALNDVTRKLLILGRTAGRELEERHVRVSPILPAGILAISEPEAFLEALRGVDARIGRLRDKALAEGARLMPVAALDAAGASVRLEAVDEREPLARLRPADNLVEIETLRYSEQPLVIQGPGAGTEVTAAGLMVDLLAAADRLVVR